METRIFHFIDDSSKKFWSIYLGDKSNYIQYGKIGTKGQEQFKFFDDQDEAAKSYEKLIKEKLKKGYVEVSAEEASKPKIVDTVQEPVEETVQKKLADYI